MNQNHGNQNQNQNHVYLPSEHNRSMRHRYLQHVRKEKKKKSKIDLVINVHEGGANYTKRQTIAYIHVQHLVEVKHDGGFEQHESARAM